MWTLPTLRLRKPDLTPENRGKSEEQKRRDEIYKRLLALKKKKQDKEARMKEIKGK